MKHQWKTDDDGEIKSVDEDGQHPVGECVLCGGLTACLYAQQTGSTCWMTGHALDADDCPGLDLTVTVQVTIRHPGVALLWEDHSSVTQTHSLTLAQVVDGTVDLVEVDLNLLAAAMVDQWRDVKRTHHEHWERAIAKHEEEGAC